ncbi:MAG TPA: tetratricopeptide repeat protein [Thermoanaerobaculia bacterium]
MKKLGVVALALAAILLPGLILGEKDKKSEEPFYRKYLLAGNPLDDKILEQEKRVAASPDSADLRNDFGNLLAARRFPREAREQYEMAMKLDPHHFLAPYNLGLLYETQGETGKAISAYEKSVNRNRGFPPSRFRLGRLYEKRGSQQKAIEQYARAIQIDPEMRDPKRNPLVVDTRLLALTSLENYPRDLATAAMRSEASYADKSLVRRLPVDRTLSTEDLKPVPAAGAPPAGPTPVQVIAPSTPPRREAVRPGPARNLPAMAAEPTPDIVVLEPTEAPTPPPLPTPDAFGRPAYIGGPRPPPPPPPTPTPGQ